MELAQASMGDVFEFAIPCHPFNPQIRHLLSLELVADLGVSSALRKPTIRRPISVSTGIKRTVNGSKEVAKCVAERSLKQVA